MAGGESFSEKMKPSGRKKTPKKTEKPMEKNNLEGRKANCSILFRKLSYIVSLVNDFKQLLLEIYLI